ncbi:MAG: hypothetical protein II175_07935, partial [Schwartzia sp.]|nr:hypothetical protein [Schwartzia sp. (in: firmicutes)]
SHGLCYRTGGDEFIVLAKADRILAEALVYQLEDEAAAWDGMLCIIKFHRKDMLTRKMWGSF